MILNPERMVDEGVIYNILDEQNQIQQNGIDLTLHSIQQIKGEGSITKEEVILPDHVQKLVKEDDSGLCWLERNTTYDVLCNEEVDIPENVCAKIHHRSSLNRMGAFCMSGLYDSGFNNQIGFMLRTREIPIMLEQDARIAQIVFMEANSAELYDGKYNK